LFPLRVSYYQTGCDLSSPLTANFGASFVFLEKAVYPCFLCVAFVGLQDV